MAGGMISAGVFVGVVSAGVSVGVVSTGVSVGVVSTGVSVGVLTAWVVAVSVVTPVPPKSGVRLVTVSTRLEMRVSRAGVVEFAKGVSTWRLTTRGK